MKKKILSAIVGVLFLLSYGMTAFAAPVVMPDGQLFDPEYYAENNPDVAAVFGTDMNLLYLHYQNNGKLEGRLPYVPGLDAEAVKAAALSVSILDSKAFGKYSSQMKGYNELPVFAGPLWQPVRIGDDVVFYTNGQMDGSMAAHNQAFEMCGQIMAEKYAGLEKLNNEQTERFFSITRGHREELVELGEFKVIDGYPNCCWKAGPSNGMMVCKITKRYYEEAR